MGEMIVCHCHGVTDRQIRGCVRDGAATVGHVSAACGAASACGGCHAHVQEIVGDELAAEGVRHPPSLPMLGHTLTR